MHRSVEVCRPVQAAICISRMRACDNRRAGGGVNEPPARNVGHFAAVQKSKKPEAIDSMRRARPEVPFQRSRCIRSYGAPFFVVTSG